MVMETAADDTGNKPVSLLQRAPTGPIPKRIWEIWLGLRGDQKFLLYRNLFEQKNPCIRSQLAHVSSRRVSIQHNPFGLNLEATSVSRFPYPTAFLELLTTELQRQASQTPSLSGIGISNHSALKNASIPGVTSHVPSNNTHEENQSGDSANNTPSEQDPSTQEESESIRTVNTQQVRWGWEFTTRLFSLSRTSVLEFPNQVQPVYVVLGIFHRGHSNPQERVVFIHKPEHLFRQLRWAAFRVRGLSSVLSLRHVRGFRLYKCDAKNGTHERIHVDSNGAADLQLLLLVFKSWYTPNHISLAWANWIHQTLNNGSYDVPSGSYALELVLDWSAARISIVVLLPVLLSLAVGLWLNAAAWTDLATIQTAWGTASYIVTVGGLLAALLAIISGIADR